MSTNQRGRLFPGWPSLPSPAGLVRQEVVLAFLLQAAMAAATGWAAAETPGTNYNLILISLTNTRADHLGVYGYSRNTSPNLDRFAKKCLVFKNAFAHASWTLPASVSLFTSQYPFTHGLMNREEFTPLPQTTPTFIDALNAAGYFTAAFVGDRDYSQKFGHTARFQYVFDAVNSEAQDDWHSYGVLRETLPPARDWLKQNKDKKFCLLLQAYDTHCPFAIPRLNRRFDPGYRGNIDFTKCYWTFEPTRPVKMRSPSGEYVNTYLLKTRPQDGENYEVVFYPEDVYHMIALYDGEIANADGMLGELFNDLAALGLENKTIVVFYSDHGDMFGKHGRFMRGGPLRGTFYDDVLHIPLLIYHPGLAPRTIDGLAQAVDLAPTLLSLLGLKSPDDFRGKSLLPLIRGNPPVNRHVFAGAAFAPSDKNPFFHHPSVIISARDQQWKLIMERLSYSAGPQDSWELYDLKKDPDELTNLAEKRPEAVRELRQAIRNWLKDIKAESFAPDLDKE
jgi:arylsulfatase A-like enzyme